MIATPEILAFLSMPGWQELLIVAFIGLLLFGRRLPEIGRSLGKGIVEFKKGLRGIEDDIEESVNRSERTLPRNGSETTPGAEKHETP